jgi:hypothetical protein
MEKLPLPLAKESKAQRTPELREAMTGKTTAQRKPELKGRERVSSMNSRGEPTLEL